MSDYIIDAHAWVEYFTGTKKGEKAKEIIEDKGNGIFTSLVTLAELISIAKRKNINYKEVYFTMLTLSKFTGLSPEFCRAVGLLHFEVKKKIQDFGMADAFVLAAARKLEAKIVTGDRHFKGFKETILIS